MVVRTCRMMLFSCFALLAGAALWGVAWLLAVNAGTHGSQLPFTVAFPWSYFLYRIALFGDHTWALKVVTFLQLPLYALVLGAFWETRWRTFVVVTLLGFHALAVGGVLLAAEFLRVVLVTRHPVVSRWILRRHIRLLFASHPPAWPRAEAVASWLQSGRS
jgi:hypothetical protein